MKKTLIEQFRGFAFIILLTGLVAGCAATKQATDTATTSSKSDEDSELKPYGEVITDEAETDEGLFDVHKVDDKYYYEVPDSLLGREMLLVSHCQNRG